MRSPNAVIDVLIELARDASDEAQEVRTDKSANFGKTMTAQFLADKIESVAREAERSIGAIEESDAG